MSYFVKKMSRSFLIWRLFCKHRKTHCHQEFMTFTGTLIPVIIKTFWNFVSFKRYCFTSPNEMHLVNKVTTDNRRKYVCVYKGFRSLIR